MTPQEHLDHIAADSARVAAIAATDLDARIEHLDWTVRELVAHLGAVYSMVLSAVTSEGTDRPDFDNQPAAPDDDTVTNWFEERRTALLSALSSVDPDAATWTFAGTKTNAWWIRRQASETALHRWDAESAITALTDVTPIDSDLATDAIDEYHAVSLRFSSSRPDRVYPAESLHLHRDDGPGEWMLMSDGGGGLTVTHEHGKGDAAVRGSASELVLWSWGRPTHNVQIFGDEAVATAWQTLAP